MCANQWSPAAEPVRSGLGNMVPYSEASYLGRPRSMAVRQKVRWPYVIAISLVGLAFTGAPFYLARQVSTDFGTNDALLSSTLTNIGTTIFLVVVVFFLERGLLQRVSDTAAESTARVVEERTTELANANQALATEIADLRAQFESAAAADTAARTAPLRTAKNEASFDTIAEALEVANGYGALEYGTVTVPLTTSTDHPELVTFDWRLHPVRLPDGRRRDDYFSPQLVVTYKASRNPDRGPGLPIVDVVWQPNQGPTDLLMALRTEMVRRNFGQEAKLVSPDLFEHLAIALEDAVAGRMAAEGAWIVGALDEWLADGWAITDAGLVSRDHGMINQEEFPKPEPSSGPGWNVFNQSLPPFDPPAPDGISEPFWKFAVGRAADKFGHRPYGFVAPYAGTRHQPFTRDDSPRNDPGWPPVPHI
jgi:hypothetical protein